MISRRGLLKGIVGLVAAPAVVKASSLMAIKPIQPFYVYNPLRETYTEIGLGYEITRKAIEDNLYGSIFMPSRLHILKSFEETKQIYAANILGGKYGYL